MNYMKFYKILFSVVITFCAWAPIMAQGIPKTGCRTDLQPTRVVVPRYLAAALSTRSQGEVTIEIEVSPQGDVTDAKTVSGNKILGGNSIFALKKWKFGAGAPDTAMRRTEIIVSYRLITRTESLTEALAVLTLPCRIEISEFLPADEASF
jgi:TonB family protein